MKLAINWIKKNWNHVKRKSIVTRDLNKETATNNEKQKKERKKRNKRKNDSSYETNK